jgi:hypothetical protein
MRKKQLIVLIQFSYHMILWGVGFIYSLRYVSISLENIVGVFILYAIEYFFKTLGCTCLILQLIGS